MTTWHPHPEATQFVSNHLDRFIARSALLSTLRDRLRDETGTRIFDWIERLALRDAGAAREFGYCPDPNESGTYRHPDALLPAISETDGEERIALRTEWVGDLQTAHPSLGLKIAGKPGSDVRRTLLGTENGVEVWAIEQHGTQRWDGSESNPPGRAVADHRAAFRRRNREFRTNLEAFRHTEELIHKAIKDLGVNWACDVFFQAEREYWESRNKAARIQKERQDTLGLGWANHDHHTYRSSRGAFVELIRLLELLGFECRERFYAGREAGWGAQVLEQPDCRVVIFADVDLAPEEVAQDFAHEPLPERGELGTVGLWCELHGEAFLQAGMHHLEAQFDFDAARQQLATLGIETMAPFTDLPYLKQAFTVGDRWTVTDERIDAVLRAEHISEKQAAKFRDVGAIGSHMEILQRDDGYKGFNQAGINEIIRETDPRQQVNS